MSGRTPLEVAIRAATTLIEAHEAGASGALSLLESPSGHLVLVASPECAELLKAWYAEHVGAPLVDVEVHELSGGELH